MHLITLPGNNDNIKTIVTEWRIDMLDETSSFDEGLLSVIRSQDTGAAFLNRHLTANAGRVENGTAKQPFGEGFLRTMVNMSEGRILGDADTVKWLNKIYDGTKMGRVSVDDNGFPTLFLNIARRQDGVEGLIENCEIIVITRGGVAQFSSQEKWGVLPEDDEELGVLVSDLNVKLREQKKELTISSSLSDLNAVNWKTAEAGGKIFVAKLVGNVNALLGIKALITRDKAEKDGQ